jgi:hypothetical protein
MWVRLKTLLKQTKSWFEGCFLKNALEKYIGCKQEFTLLTADFLLKVREALQGS